jgi:hypothetical protein
VCKLVRCGGGAFKRYIRCARQTDAGWPRQDREGAGRDHYISAPGPKAHLDAPELCCASCWHRDIGIALVIAVIVAIAFPDESGHHPEIKRREMGIPFPAYRIFEAQIGPAIRRSRKNNTRSAAELGAPPLSDQVGRGSGDWFGVLVEQRQRLFPKGSARCGGQ